MARPIPNPILIRGNLLKAVNKFQAAAQPILEYNERHPNFPLQLVPKKYHDPLLGLLVYLSQAKRLRLSDVT